MVRILPPRQLYLPVLPYKSNGKLTFPLCRTCVETRASENCEHSDPDRSLVGTWCTPELVKAVELGYQIEKIFEVWHYPESREYLFRDYIDTFLKLKVEASGLPEGVVTEEQIAGYIAQFFEQEGVVIEREKISKNPGMRAFAKLCLNSFWGRLGMQDARLSTVFINSAKELYDYLLSGKYSVSITDLLPEPFLIARPSAGQKHGPLQRGSDADHLFY